MVYSESDDTLFGALRKTSQKVARQLFFAHTQQVVIGEALAKEGIGDLFDFFERSHELRMSSHVLIARNTEAESVLRILTSLEKDQAEGIVKREKISSEIWGNSLDNKIIDVVKALLSKGETAISGIRVKGNITKGSEMSNKSNSKLPTYIQIDGIALFKDKKLVKWLDGNEARGTLWLQNKMKGTVVNLPCKESKEEAAVELIRSETKVNITMMQGKPMFHIHIKEDGTVNEVHCPMDLSKRDVIVHLQNQWAKETEVEVKEAIQVAQSQKSDIFGFGEELKRQYPKEWKQIKDHWQDVFADCQVETTIEAYIRRTGMRSKPYFIEQ
ncbi:Ger(x)C family spore germination protein [Paenibacillus hexagrammi]|uniref:Ger(X)C family spore germination protein n=1 Tax=Paenibacillus hexagrammi TaxID=2908839 RepID=A0ABY3SE37_9BACL|nr:Ger(x)C family spore germination protein [Paenibacillus sp. YPD9-1]UJF31685.1 Ger(x)C family spore germination protein [Paenibacillus sp. YPD9-1]